jgi:hypothetical protein
MIRRQAFAHGADHRFQSHKGNLLNFAISLPGLQDQVTRPVRPVNWGHYKFIAGKELVADSRVKTAFAQAFDWNTSWDKDFKFIPN